MLRQSLFIILVINDSNALDIVDLGEAKMKMDTCSRVECWMQWSTKSWMMDWNCYTSVFDLIWSSWKDKSLLDWRLVSLLV